jgi:hypothetical protein
MLVDIGQGQVTVVQTTGYVLLLFQGPLHPNCGKNMLKVQGLCEMKDMHYFVKQFCRLWEA